MSRIYLKLVRYFIILIVTTCLASTTLFFLIVGYPMAKDFHRLLRKHVKFTGSQTSELIQKGSSIEEVHHFLLKSADSYEAGIVLFDEDLEWLAGTKRNEIIDGPITDAMIQEVQEKGLYVQSSHMGRPLIYILPVSTKNSGKYYLYIQKKFSRFKRFLVFSMGLVIICLFLILAIYPLAKGFTKPLSQLTEALSNIAGGNFDSTIDIGKRNDELGDLLTVFHDMRKSVDSMIESRKALLADISHELRSPLGRLGIAAELIKVSEQTDDIAGYVDNIEYEISFMDNLLKQLSDYSTLNLPEIKLNIESVCTSEIIETISNRYKSVMESHDIQLISVVNLEHLFINIDSSRFLQVLNNLLDNAINATEPGGEIKIGLTEKEEDVVFFVANNGNEIPEHEKEKIFEPLFRADPSRNRKTGGLGLGLAISKKIIEHLGGTIHCESDKGITTFYIRLKKAFSNE